MYKKAKKSDNPDIYELLNSLENYFYNSLDSKYWYKCAEWVGYT